MTHLAMAFAIAHPGVSSAIIGPRTMEQLDDLLAGIDVTLSDEIVPPGTDVGTLDMAYRPVALQRPDPAPTRQPTRRSLTDRGVRQASEIARPVGSLRSLRQQISSAARIATSHAACTTNGSRC
jgi:hypothetical protein